MTPMEHWGAAEWATVIFLGFIGWGYASVVLGLILWSMRDRYQGWHDRRMDAKIDKLFKEHDKRRAPSSTCAEHSALNREVPGSNPGGLTRRENPVRQRITWHLDESTAIAFFPNEPLPTKFTWWDLPRPRDEKSILQAGITRFRDFKPGEPQVQLIWDGTQCEKFLNGVELKKFLIRFVYGIDQRFLIPSELLADANLAYETGDWVDGWFCTDKNDEIIECPREIFRPRDRKVRHDLKIVSGETHRALKSAGGPRRSDERTSRTHDIPARVEIPDEKCFFRFKEGGFYEKADSSACKKG